MKIESEVFKDLFLLKISLGNDINRNDRMQKYWYKYKWWLKIVHIYRKIQKEAYDTTTDSIPVELWVERNRIVLSSKTIIEIKSVNRMLVDKDAALPVRKCVK